MLQLLLSASSEAKADNSIYFLRLLGGLQEKAPAVSLLVLGIQQVPHS